MPKKIQRPSGRAVDQLRTITFTPHYTKHAEGSVLVAFGDTKVLCTASIENRVPPFLKDKGQGWLTAEYSMLPRATHTRHQRENQKPSGRTQEIQRLIGRALRGAVNLHKLGEMTVYLDCDVIQADGGTRTASITGAYVALSIALKKIKKLHAIENAVGAISVGMYQNTPVLDLDYLEDSNCDSDVNVIMTDKNELIEIQGTAEGVSFSRSSLNQLLDLAELGLNQIFELQRQAIEQA